MGPKQKQALTKIVDDIWPNIHVPFGALSKIINIKSAILGALNHLEHVSRWEPHLLRSCFGGARRERGTVPRFPANTLLLFRQHAVCQSKIIQNLSTNAESRFASTSLPGAKHDQKKTLTIGIEHHKYRFQFRFPIAAHRLIHTKEYNALSTTTTTKRWRK